VQTVTATLDAAVVAFDAEPIIRLRVDWNRSGSFTDLAVKDLTADVDDVSLSRELTTDLPEQARLYAGSSAATSTIVLSHHDPAETEQHAAWYYSPRNTASPLYAYERKGAPVQLEVGYVTDAGREYILVFTGTVRTLQVERGGQTATMTLADGAATMRKEVTLPMVVAEGFGSTDTIRPGLTTTFLADWVLRACGYYASPPARADCRMLATHHGSGWPEVGVIQHHHGQTGSQIAYAPTPSFNLAPKFVMAAGMNGNSGQEVTYILGGGGALTTNNGGELLWEGWRKFNSVAVDQPLFILYNTGTGDPYVSAFWQASTGRITLTYSRSIGDGDHASTAGPVVSPGTTNWHYYGIQVGFSSSTVDVTWRYDGTTTGTESIATTSTVGAGALDTIGLARGKISAFATGYSNAWIEADQATGESSTTTWNNNYTPTAVVQASAGVDSRLLATPNVTENGWELLQKIAESEYATVGFSEAGVPFYWPRDRWSTPPYTTSQRTLTTATSLKDLATLESMDQVYNRVTIKAQVPIVTGSQTVWKLGAPQAIEASSSITIDAETEDPIANPDLFFNYQEAGGSSRYLAGDRTDGQGNQISDLSIVASVLGPTTVRMVISNPHAFRVWLIADENATATYQGQPFLWLDAQVVQFSQPAGEASNQRISAVDAASIAAFDVEQVLEVPDSEFRQDMAGCQLLANDLLADLADPLPAIPDVPIIGDPRLQLADRVTIADPSGMAFTDDYHLAKYVLGWSPSEGLNMTVSLRGA
jgi:hypothetical protein